MLSARNISPAGIDLNAGFRLVSEKDFLEEVRRADPQPGDVLLTIVGTIGRTTIVSEHHLPFCLQRSVALLRPKDDLHPAYLNYWIQTPRLQRFFALNARGTAQKGVYLKTLKTAPVEYPDVEEQKSICAELDNSLSRLNACVHQLEIVQAKLKKARASILKAAVGGRLVETKNATELSINQASPSHGQCIPSHWQMRSIRDLFDQRLGKMLDKAKNSGDLTPYLRNANVRWQSFDLNDLKLMRISRKEIQETSVKHGDLVVCEGGEPGRCAVWKSHQNVVIQKALHRLRAREPLNPVFFSYQLEDAVGGGRIEHLYTGSTIKHLTGAKLKQIMLASPPLEEQDIIVAEVERRLSVLDQVEATVNASLRRCGQLRQAVLKRAFGG